MIKQLFTAVLLVLISVTSVFAQQISLPLVGQDFTTLDGDKYSNVTVKRIEPDGIVVSDADGIRKLKFKNLPAEIGIKYGYDPVRAAQYQANLQASAMEGQQQAEKIHKDQLAAQQQADQIQKAALTAKQPAEEQDERFATWTQEQARENELLQQKLDYAKNARNPDPFALNHNEAREQGANEAKAYQNTIKVFDARLETLRQLVAILDKSGTSQEKTQHLIDAVYEKKVFIGMPSSFVLLSWGEPTKVNSMTTEQGSSEQWVYRRSEIEADYVNVDNGVVTSIQN